MQFNLVLMNGGSMDPKTAIFHDESQVRVVHLMVLYE